MPAVTSTSSRKSLLLFSLLAALLLFPWLGNRSFATRGEPREAIVAQSMLTSGNWILGQAYNDGVPSKPPLLHWLISLASLPQGHIDEFSARLPGAISSFIFMLAFFVFVSRRLGMDLAWASSLMLLTSIEWHRASQSARVDMLLSSLLAGGLLALFIWEERGLKGWPIWPILCLAGATLTKGPVSIVLPSVIWVLYLLWRRFSIPNVIWRSLQVFLPTLVIAGLWYVLAYFYGGDRFWDKFYNENIARFLGTMDDEPHKHSVLFLFVTVLLGFLPWSLLSLKFVGWPKNGILPGLKNTLGNLQSLDKLNFFSSLIIICFLVFYSIPESRRSIYLLPMYPFCALGAARIWERWSDKTQASLRAVTYGLLAFVVLAGMGMGWIWLSDAWIFSRFKPSAELLFIRDRLLALSYPAGWLCVSGLFGFAVAIYARLKKNRVKFELGLAALIYALFVVSTALFIPQFNNPLSERPVAALLNNFRNEDLPVYSYANEFYGTSFYARQQMYRLEEAHSPPRALVILYPRNLPDLKEKLGPSYQIDQLGITREGIIKAGDRAAIFRIQPLAANPE